MYAESKKTNFNVVVDLLTALKTTSSGSSKLPLVVLKDVVKFIDKTVTKLYNSGQVMVPSLYLEVGENNGS